MSSSMFQPIYDKPFTMYSLSHLIWFAVLLAFSFALWHYRLPIQTNSRLKRMIRICIILALILPQIVLYIWYSVEHLWDVQSSLPLELCSITLYLSAVMLMTRNYLLYQILFFAGIGGAMQALLTPNLHYAFPHFIYFHFFIGHCAIILASLYMTWIENYKPTLKSIGITMIFLNITAVIVGTINLFLDTNYMFLMHKPTTPSILDWLGPYPFYLIGEEFIAVVLFFFMHLLFRLKPENRP